VAIKISVFDFEFFMGDRGQKKKELTALLKCQLFDVVDVSLSNAN
jgi:hypothetical protein